MNTLSLQFAMGGEGSAGSFPWPPKKRAALPPNPTPGWDRGSQIVWTRLPMRTQLPPWAGTPPDVRIVRAGFSNVRVPGLQWKPGMGGINNQGPNGPICMDLDIFKFKGDATSIGLIFQAHQDRGYTHFQFSLGDADRQGWTPTETAALGQRWRQEFGGYADWWYLGGGRENDQSWKWCARDQDWSYWGPLTAPWTAALVAAGVIDAWCAGWQLEGYNTGSSLLSTIKGFHTVAELQAAKVRAYHNLFDAGAWWDDKTPYHDRFGFWAYMLANNLLNYLHFQCNTESPINAPPFTDPGGMQGGAHDVLRAMSGSQRVVPYEYAGQDQFDDPIARPEWSGDQRGRLILGSIGDSGDASQLPGGFGCGGRGDDGGGL